MIHIISQANKNINNFRVFVRLSVITVLCQYKGEFRPFNFENTIMNYGLGVMAWACTNNLRVVLGPCTQYCSREASKHKMIRKPKTYKNEIELSCISHSIRLDGLIILMWSDVEIG